ncbi:MarR family transcriptional regulator [Micromonospora polyrhachis]|uniref:DNA-binding MarR family transcriptional regulator n=1 Tax=Micromonospora polyrhachis TaxID=1282883 RepID=A0A7W7SMI3_9ACTN|nr:MarR family transcriptional regulator [Micromonospora polyrhachis]MBB4957518.1 DNA-binding MarR family transcriptional regulator [Micromonospora polyrhachis]
MDDDSVSAVEHELAVLLRRARATSGEIAREVHPALEPTAYGLLVWIRRCGPARLTDLATEMRMSKGNLSRQISALETMGLLQRQADPVDGRAFRLDLTDEGHRRFNRARKARTAQLQQILREWSPTDRAEFARLLHQFNDDAR